MNLRKKLFRVEWSEAIFLIGYRIIGWVLLKNYDYPDEYWQGPEISHKIFYGYGYETWEWTIEEPIRNPLGPLILSLGFGVISFLPGNWEDELIGIAPSLIQLLLAFITDIFLLKLTKHVYGKVRIKQLFLLFSNWYYWGMMCRMYSNTLEAFCTIVGLYFWLKRKENTSFDILSRFVVCFAYVLRPTSLILWVFIWPYELFTSYRPILSADFFKFILKNMLTVFMMVLASFTIGSLYFGRLVLTEFNFFKCNFYYGWSQLYGVNSPFFYFFISLPFMLAFSGIFFLLSIYQLSRKSQKEDKSIIKYKQLREICIFILFYLFASSLSKHKQHRFIFPIVPLILMIGLEPLIKNKKLALKWLYFLSILTNIVLFLIFNTFGKEGCFELLQYLRNQIPCEAEQNISLILMGQSHFIPFYSILHRNITLKIPDSSPMKMAKKQSENDLLISNPQQLYSILTQNTGDANYMIVQGKYFSNIPEVIFEKYEKINEWRQCHFFEQLFFGYDSLILYKSIQM